MWTRFCEEEEELHRTGAPTLKGRTASAESGERRGRERQTRAIAGLVSFQLCKAFLGRIPTEESCAVTEHRIEMESESFLEKLLWFPLFYLFSPSSSAVQVIASRSFS